jgi:hypothetical protein
VRFCRQFRRVCSRSGCVNLSDHRLGRCCAIDVPPDDALDLLLTSSKDFGDDPLRHAGNVELRRRRSSQIMKMQITIIHAGGNLRSVDRGSKSVPRPGTAPLIGQDRGRAARAAAAELNTRKIATPTGAPSSAMTVIRARKRLAAS